MNLQRFLLGSLLVFLLGITLLYTGANRAPFRQCNPGHRQQHQSSLPNSAAVCDTDDNPAPICPPGSVKGS